MQENNGFNIRKDRKVLNLLFAILHIQQFTLQG